ncbi:hypothetical protein [Vibrio genomosp. F10]|uniref:hypothetical protein n=1 Tax=Vibrio genomosp. F10 TaxID=723171 RepID=UPI0002DBDE87|nr:hypothetical protein [Vibrio genomosp. F10]
MTVELLRLSLNRLLHDRLLLVDDNDRLLRNALVNWAIGITSLWNGDVNANDYRPTDRAV